MTRKPLLFSIQPPPYRTAEERVDWLAATSHGPIVHWHPLELVPGTLVLTSDRAVVTFDAYACSAEVRITRSQTTQRLLDGDRIVTIPNRPTTSVSLRTTHGHTRLKQLTKSPGAFSLEVACGNRRIRLTHATLTHWGELGEPISAAEYDFVGWGLEYQGRHGMLEWFQREGPTFAVQFTRESIG